MTTFLEHIVWDNKIAIGLFVQNYTMKMQDERKKQKLSLNKVIRRREFNLAQVLRIHTPKRPGQALIESPRSSMYKSSLQSPFIPVFRSLKSLSEFLVYSEYIMKWNPEFQVGDVIKENWFVFLLFYWIKK